MILMIINNSLSFIAHDTKKIYGKEKSFANMRKIEISVTPHLKVTEHQIVPGPDQTSPCKGNLETIILIIIIISDDLSP